MYCEFKSKYTPVYYSYISKNLINKDNFTLTIKKLREILNIPKSYSSTQVIDLLKRIINELTRVLDSRYRKLEFDIIKVNNRINELVFRVIKSKKNNFDYVLKSNEIENFSLPKTYERKLRKLYQSENIVEEAEKLKKEILRGYWKKKNGY
ncbi:hypothetical protein [Sebaldella sp. S0638]|uniref:hypothetical protein n=1 Tax=Sebaldella sp. S0638 TaxID=2957809 RepID=UPI00209EA037|nr:hypothetical protein [Sebaldella sp. S0638]MCP1225755.1 hypothetical protein [Sebaldella sp. S0638]